MPWSASSGAQSSASPRPSRTSEAAAHESTAAGLFRDHVLKAGEAKDRKDGVVQSEKPEAPSRIVAHRGADAPDDDRDRERQEEQRQQQLARAAGDRHRRDEGADRAD